MADEAKSICWYDILGWSCSLDAGHTGDHIAYEFHEIGARILGTVAVPDPVSQPLPIHEDVTTTIISTSCEPVESHHPQPELSDEEKTALVDAKFEQGYTECPECASPTHPIKDGKHEASTELPPHEYMITHEHRLKARERWNDKMMPPDSHAEDIAARLEAVLEHVDTLEAALRESIAAREEAERRLSDSICDKNPVPQHAFEVRINIGGEDWEYVLRVVKDLAYHLEDHGPECRLISGGGGGSHSVTVAKHLVTPEKFHEEMRTYIESLKAESLLAANNIQTTGGGDVE